MDNLCFISDVLKISIVITALYLDIYNHYLWNKSYLKNYYKSSE